MSIRVGILESNSGINFYDFILFSFIWTLHCNHIKWVLAGENYYKFLRVKDEFASCLYAWELLSFINQSIFIGFFYITWRALACYATHQNSMQCISMLCNTAGLFLNPFLILAKAVKYDTKRLEAWIVGQFLMEFYLFNFNKRVSACSTMQILICKN